MAELTATTDADFDTDVFDADGLVLVDFWAPWCGPCRMVHPILAELDAEREDVTVLSVNVDENPQVSGRYQVFSIPTMLLFDKGELVKQVVGAQSKRALQAELFEA